MDWDDAYANARHISGGDAYPDRWIKAAARFRDTLALAGRARLDVAYGAGKRHRYDLFLPEGASRGLFVFIHGGYWMAFDKASWSHLANGALALGFQVAVPSYSLCPEATVSSIVAEISGMIEMAANECSGPVVLCGHSAGGHIATRLISDPSPLAAPLARRLACVISISGLHDLRPLLQTAMNDTLRLTPEQAEHESPALLNPAFNCPAIVCVGASERPEFLRQSRLLVDAWSPFQVPMRHLVIAGRHHFDVIDDIQDPRNEILTACSDILLGGEH